MSANKGKRRPYWVGVIILVAIFWAVTIINFLTGYSFLQLALVPRTFNGLIGILTAPFLHAGFSHLTANTISFAVLGALVGLNGRWAFWETTIFIIFVSGAGLWLVGRPSYHLGASGLVFGYFGYLVMRGLVQKKITALLVAAAVVFAYGGLIWGILPTSSHVSWEGHLCGFVAGIIAARFEGA
jgi:membrane associated rhomboid family serine protease